MGRVYQRKLVLGMIQGAFPSISRMFFLGGKGLSSYFSLFPFIVVFFLLNGVPRVGTCLISLSLQLLGVVVRTEKYGSVRHKALNVIVAAFSLDASVFSIVFFCFSAFPALWNDIECRYW